MRRYKAILFDFDGVLADTMEDNFKAWEQAFSSHNIRLDRETYFLLEGMNVRGVAEHILKQHQRDPSLAVFIGADKERLYEAGHAFRLYPGVLEMIEALRPGFALGLVSGASAVRLRTTTPQALLNQFSVIIDGDTVHHAKPHPAPYLAAAAALGVAPENCLVVENAPLGIASAKNAGMDCVAVTSTLERRHLAGADHIVESIGGVQLIVAQNQP
ncbi:MAG: HAD family phosphatase [Desulfatitalea sp.]